MSPTPTDPNQAQAWITGDPPDQTIDFYIPRGNTGPMGPQGPIGPSVSVGEIVVTNGPPAPGTVGPQGGTGPKGDPGGFTLGTILTATTDLNTVITSGLYRIEGAPNTGLNWPVISSGVLTVIQRSTTNYLMQEFTPLWANNSWNGTTLYRRWNLNGVWSTWKTFNSLRVDQTAGRVLYQWDDLNNREQMVWGDTGMRTVTANMLSSFDNTGALRNLNIRRSGSIVSISGQMLVASGVSASTQLNAYTIPLGFRAANGLETTCLHLRGNTSLLRMYTNGNDLCVQTVSGNSLGNMVAGDIMNVNVSYMTTDVWPTSLPGTAFGTVPSG